MFSATLTLDGIAFIVEVKSGDVEICLPGYDSESIALSPTNAQLLASAIFAAVHEIEEGDA